MAQGRAKRPHQKVKTGCLTCRKRRIKCDEGKPSCQQCRDSLRRCEGYQPPQTWLFKPQQAVDINDNTNGTSNAMILQFVSPLTPIGDANDRRSFQFWHEQAAPIFSSYFGRSFWYELLPKVGVDQPAVKHLLLATSSLVESAAREGFPLSENPVYQLHYSKALQEARHSPQVENVLLACLMFACCEFMKGSAEGGLRHIKAGLSIIEEWIEASRTNDKQLSSAAMLILQTIGPIFLAYIDKAPTYGMGHLPCSENSCTTMIRGNTELPAVDKFYEIHRAHHALDGVAHHIARLADYRIPAWKPSSPQRMQTLLDTWRVHFDAFETNMMDTRRKRFALTLQLLRVHHTTLSIMLKAASSRHETIYEDFIDDFTWIVKRYDEFAEIWSRDESLKFFASPGNLEYHMGYIPPLFLTATKCRDPIIRAAALKHLGSLRVMESNWSSCTAYLVARSIIEIENNRAIQNKRSDLKDEHDLIRPVEAFITDKHNTQAGLDYLIYPYDMSPMMRESIDLQGCPLASTAHWPLCRIIRIGGYQGGALTPISTGCYCGAHYSREPLLLRPKLKGWTNGGRTWV